MGKLFLLLAFSSYYGQNILMVPMLGTGYTFRAIGKY